MPVDIEIPITDIEEEAERPSRTYRLDTDSGRIAGTTDGLDAVNQAIKKAIITSRFSNLIYNDDYGSEVGDMVHGQIGYSRTDRNGSSGAYQRRFVTGHKNN